MLIIPPPSDSMNPHAFSPRNKTAERPSADTSWLQLTDDNNDLDRMRAKIRRLEREVTRMTGQNARVSQDFKDLKSSIYRRIVQEEMLAPKPRVRSPRSNPDIAAWELQHENPMKELAEEGSVIKLTRRQISRLQTSLDQDSKECDDMRRQRRYAMAAMTTIVDIAKSC